ncbi:hypothetical protein BD769DRAFT_1641569, partial [Suillus cothurnatus]
PNIGSSGVPWSRSKSIYPFARPRIPSVLLTLPVFNGTVGLWIKTPFASAIYFFTDDRSL